jgi:hypothetical protein
MERNPVGRTTKLTKQTKEKILYAIRKGAPYELACNYARISYGVFWLWKQKAEYEKIPEFIQFFEDVREAEGETALKWLSKIDDAMDAGTWQAASWKLERRHYKHFSAQTPIIDMNERMTNIEHGDLRGKKDEKGSQKDDQEVRQEGRNEGHETRQENDGK